jgi:hypothetical protein
VALTCRLLGHSIRFWNEGDEMHWECERDCGFGGSKTYPDPQTARRFATAFDRDDRRDLGKRAPLSLTPLRLVRRARS